MSDSRSQFTSLEWHTFATDFGFKILNCNPLRQANGEAEKAVQTLKTFSLRTKIHY